MSEKVQLRVIGGSTLPARRAQSTAKLQLLAEVTGTSPVKEEKITSQIIRDFLENDYKQLNCCPVVQKALNRIHNIRVFNDRVQISFSTKGQYQVPQNILSIISRDVHNKFFKENRFHSVQCINLKGH